MLKFTEFMEEVTEHIREYLPHEYHNAVVTIEDIIKNNDSRYHAIFIKKEDDTSGPVIQMEPLFNDYRNGVSLNDILKNIAEMRVQNDLTLNGSISKIQNFDKIKNSIVMRLINTDMNKNMLKDAPHRKVADLSICYDIITDEIGVQNGRIRIKNDLLGKIGVTEQELYEVAIENTPRLFPGRVSSIGDILHNNIDGSDSNSLFSEDMPFKVVTNAASIFGASAILYQGMIESITENIGDFYIIPSSVHELIAVSQSVADVDALRKMVHDVNNTLVDPEEILSYEVYEMCDGLLTAISDNEKIAV